MCNPPRHGSKITKNYVTFLALLSRQVKKNVKNYELIVVNVKHSFEVFRVVPINRNVHPVYDQLQKLDESRHFVPLHNMPCQCRPIYAS